MNHYFLDSQYIKKVITPLIHSMIIMITAFSPEFGPVSVRWYPSYLPVRSSLSFSSSPQRFSYIKFGISVPFLSLSLSFPFLYLCLSAYDSFFPDLLRFPIKKCPKFVFLLIYFYPFLST